MRCFAESWLLNPVAHLTTVMKAPDKVMSGTELLRLRKTTEAYTETNQSASPMTSNP